MSILRVPSTGRPRRFGIPSTDERGKLEARIESPGGTAMRTIMKWIDGIVSKLARRKVQRDEGNAR
jgi:hypothetical protein